MKRFLIVFALSLSLCLTLAGCGEIPKDVGNYNCIGYCYKGVKIIDSSFNDSGSFIRLSTHGRGVFSHQGLSGELSWLSGGEYIEIKIGGRNYEGSLKNGIIELGIADNLTALFRWDQLPPLEEGSESRSYYGWWKITEPQGEMPETWIDCCARIKFENGQPELLIWDEDGSEKSPMGRARLEVKDGVFENTDGNFWYSELEPGEWVLNAQENEFENCIILSGSAVEREGQSFNYEIMLRPWGTLWDDVEAEKPRLLPFYYRDFYLPLIEEGKDMPESIELK